MDFLKNVKDLDLYLLNTRTPNCSEAELVEIAFGFWQDQWQKNFDSINVDYGTTLSSDDFLSRNACALFYKKQPVGLFFNSSFKSSKSHLAHSYFKNYPDDVLNILKVNNINSFMTLSYMTVDKDWTKSYTDYPVSEILFSIAIKQFKASNYNFLILYIRTDRGNFHKVFERHGGKILKKSKAYNVNVNFSYVSQKNARISNKDGVNYITEALWKKYLLYKNLNENEENYELFR